MDAKEATKRLEEHFGDRITMIGFCLIQLSMSGQPCDVTFYRRKPIISVCVDQQLSLALLYGAGPKRLAEMLDNIKFSDGTKAGINEIWGVHPMPKGGFTEEELAAVDISQAEEPAGPNGETVRQMIRETYHCETVDEENKYLRRFIAS